MKISLKFLKNVPIRRYKGETTMTIARYIELNHPHWKYRVELIVILGSKGKRVKIAEFNCVTDKELEYATECCDYVLKGE